MGVVDASAIKFDQPEESNVIKRSTGQRLLGIGKDVYRGVKAGVLGTINQMELGAINPKVIENQQAALKEKPSWMPSWLVPAPFTPTQIKTQEESQKRIEANEQTIRQGRKDATSPTAYAVGEQIVNFAPFAAMPGANIPGLVRAAGGAAIGSGLARTIAPENPTADIIGQVAGATGPREWWNIAAKGYNALAGPASLLPNAERIYGSASKMPLSKKWVSQLPREEISKRERAIQEGIESEVPVSKFGAQKARNISENSKTNVESIVDRLTAQGLTVDTEKLLEEGLKDAYKAAAASNDPAAAKNLVDEWANTYRTGKGMKMTPRQVQDSKLFNQKQSQYAPSETQAAHRQVGQAISKGMAHQAMLMLENLEPDLQKLNRSSAAYHDLEEAINRAYSREGNTNIVGLGTKALAAGSHPVLAAIDHVLGLPYVKTKLSFALARARTRPIMGWIRPTPETPPPQARRPQ
jgi:hypothetical protein